MLLCLLAVSELQFCGVTGVRSSVASNSHHADAGLTRQAAVTHAKSVNRLYLTVLSEVQICHVVGVRSSAAASTSQGRDAASARQAAEIDSDIDRLLETASSGGMSAGLEFDLSADDSPGSIVREMQASRGNPDQQSRMLPLL